MTVPKHVAIIMDGNGRWAQQRQHSRIFGHIRGSKRIKEIIREAGRMGIKALTLYAFSTENWSRPENELKILWKILKKYLITEVDSLDRENVCLKIIGEVERLSSDVQTVIKTTVSQLEKNTGLKLTLCISYGGRREIVNATRMLLEDCLNGKILPESLHENLMWSYLWTKDLGELAEVDLIIRTSGEKRISNFLIWQAAYAEYVFMDVLWPDFRSHHLSLAIEEFNKRKRRFGGIEDTTSFIRAI